MSTAAYALGVDRRIDWLSELDVILEDWDHMPEAARSAVGKVVRSLIDDPTVPSADVARAAALMARHRRRRPCDLV